MVIIVIIIITIICNALLFGALPFITKSSRVDDWMLASTVLVYVWNIKPLTISWSASVGAATFSKQLVDSRVHGDCSHQVLQSTS